VTETRLLVADLFRAGDRTRTGDVQLGKLAFYQLNYAREALHGNKLPLVSGLQKAD
jgi:hypothetical protein